MTKAGKKASGRKAPARKPVRDVPPWHREPKTVAIVAMGRSNADFLSAVGASGSVHNVCDQVWGINTVPSIIKCDLCFMMDDLKKILGNPDVKGDPTNGELVEWARNADCPIITSRAYDEFPTSWEYPLEDVINEIKAMPWLETTIDYAIMFADYLGSVKTLKMYGCDFFYDNIQAMERGLSCATHHLTRFMEYEDRQVKVGASSTLLSTNIQNVGRCYGYDPAPAFTVKEDHIEVSFPEEGS